MLVLATFTPVTETKGEVVKIAEIVEAVETAGAGKNGKKSEGEYPENLAQVSCIQYFISFRKKSVPVLTLFDSGNKVNAIHLTFVKELDLPIRPTDVGAQKINDTMLYTFGIIVIAFSVTDKAN